MSFTGGRSRLLAGYAGRGAADDVDRRSAEAMDVERDAYATGALDVDRRSQLDMPQRELVQGRGIGDRHSEIMEAVTNITVDPPDLQPILDAIARLGDGGGRHSEVMEAITNIVVEPPDLQPILKAIARLDQGGGGKHSEVLEAITNIVVDPPDLQPILNAIARLDQGSKHEQVLRAISEIVIEPPDLSPVLRAIQNQNFGDKHSQLLDMIRKIVIEPPDLTPILRAIRDLNASGRHSEILEAVASLAVEPPDLSPIQKSLQQLRAELKGASEDARRDLEALAADLRQDLATLRQEARSDTESLYGELRALPRALDEMRQMMRKLDQKVDQGEVLQAVRKIKLEPDYQAIANAVHGRVMKVDHSEVIGHLKRLEPDHAAMATVFIDRLKKVNVNVDHGEILTAVRKIRVPDHQEIANAVHDKISRTTLSVDHDEVLKEVRRLKRDPDLSPLLSAIQSMEVDFTPVMDAVNSINVDVDHTPVLEEIRRIKMPDHHEIAGILHDKIKKSTFSVDHSEVLKEIRRFNVQPDLSPIVAAINSAEVDLSPIHESISKLDLTVDHSPVLEALQQINIPDHQDVAAAVHDRLRKSNIFPDHAELLREVKKLRVDPDYSPILSAINSAEIDLAPIHDAISRIDFKVDHGEVLQAIKRIQIPDHNTIASAVHDRIRKGSALPDHNELIKEVRKARDSNDVTQVLEAINAAEVDFTPVIEEIQKVNIQSNVSVDNTSVLTAIEQLRSELLAAREAKPEQPPAQMMVQVPMVQTVQAASNQVLPGACRIIEERITPPVTLPTKMVWEQPQQIVQPIVAETVRTATPRFAMRPQPAVPTMSWQPAPIPGGSISAIPGGSIMAQAPQACTSVAGGFGQAVTAEATEVLIEGADGALDSTCMSPRPVAAAAGVSTVPARAAASPVRDRSVQRGPPRY